MTFSSALTCTEKTLFETTTLEVKDGQAIPRLFCSCMCVLGGGEVFLYKSSNLPI